MDKRVIAISALCVGTISSAILIKKSKKKFKIVKPVVAPYWSLYECDGKFVRTVKG